MEDQIVLRQIKSDDCSKISQAFGQQGWNKPTKQYAYYLELQENGTRDVIIAEVGGEFAGYLTIKWQSDYLPFQQSNIPEIVDFNVLKKFQRRGIGSALMDEAEARIRRVSTIAGIGFGVHKDYGAAQILYAKRNYIPDGNGLVINSKSVHYGQSIVIDDSTVMCLTKEL